MTRYNEAVRLSFTNRLRDLSNDLKADLAHLQTIRQAMQPLPELPEVPPEEDPIPCCPCCGTEKDEQGESPCDCYGEDCPLCGKCEGCCGGTHGEGQDEPEEGNGWHIVDEDEEEDEDA